MNQLRWRPLSLADRDSILIHIAQDNPSAAIDLDLEFEGKAENARQRPKLHKPERVKGTREILRVLHAAQQWPWTNRAVPAPPDGYRAA